MTRTSSFTVRMALGLLAAAALGACDAPQQALGPTLPDRPSLAAGVMYGRYKPSALVTCTVNRLTLVVQCGSPQAPFGTAPVGGEGTHVRLLPSAVSYNAGTQKLSMNMAIQNLLVNQIGTADGPTITGLNAFFQVPPQVTSGSGVVTVANHDGSAFFTNTNQRYFFYNEKIGKLVSTAPRLWQFNVPTTVNSFSFGVYVAAEKLPVIVFDKTEGGNRDIYRVALDGSDLVRMTFSSSVDMDPAVGVKTVVYVTYRFGNAELMSQPIGGGTETRLTTSLASESQPTVSLNDQLIAYISDVSGTPKLYRAAITGATQVAMTSKFGTGGSIESSPFFNPGNSIGFTTTHNARDAEIFIAKTTKVDPLVTAATNEFEGAFNTTGNSILFTTDRDAGDTEIYWKLGASLFRVTNRVGVDMSPQWTPEAPARVVYIGYDPTPKLFWKLPLAAGTNLINTGGTGTPANPSVVLAY